MQTIQLYLICMLLSNKLYTRSFFAFWLNVSQMQRELSLLGVGKSRNETKRNETKRNETKRNRIRKPNHAQTVKQPTS